MYEELCGTWVCASSVRLVFMRIEGPFTRDQILSDPPVYDEADENIGDELFDVWKSLIPSQPSEPPAVALKSQLMTPISRSSSGLLGRLDEVWGSELETPLAPLGAAPQAIIGSPLTRPTASMAPRLPSKLHNVMDEEVPVSSPGSKQDLFQELNSEVNLEPEKVVTHSVFDQLTGVLDDVMLADVTQLTPLALRTGTDPISNTVVEDNDDVVMEDLFDDFDGVDFGEGLTQMQHFITDTPFTDASGPLDKTAHFTSPAIVQQEKAGFSFASGKKVPPPSELSLRRASELFRDVELAVCTPRTPCVEDTNWVRSSLGGSVLEGTIGDNSQTLINTETAPLIGFSSASGKKLELPSKASLEKAKQLFFDEEENIPCPANTTNVGFTSAAGKRIQPPSEQSLMKARSLFNEEKTESVELTSVALFGFAAASGRKIAPPTEAALEKARNIIEEDLGNNNKETDAASFGFASAAGKSIRPPSEQSLKKARGLFKEEPVAKKTSATFDPRKRSLIPTPKFTDLKTIATKTLGTTGRKSSRASSLGGRLISKSPAAEKHVSFLIPKKELPTNDPLRYFDLSIPEKRISLRDLPAPPIINSLDPCWIDNEKIYEQFVKKGIDLKCVCKRWVDNHVELIWWKVASILGKYPDCKYYGEQPINKIILDQLLYRYEREVNLAHRSPLKKIAEGDESPVGVFIFLVKAINAAGNELLLSDGWYSLWTVIDAGLGRLVSAGKIKIGCKIQVANVALVKGEPCAILDAEDSGFKLQICYNSTRMCKWHEPLGRKRSFSFLRPLQYVHAVGGMVPCLEVVVRKIYPEIIVVHWEDGKVVEKSKREWDLMLTSTSDDVERTSSVSKSIRLEIADSSSKTLSFVKLSKVTEDLCNLLCPGRKLRIFNSKPIIGQHSKMMEFRVYQSGRQCFAVDMDLTYKNEDAVLEPTSISGFVPGRDYDIAFRVVRACPTEGYLWGINANKVLVSIGLGHFQASVPKLAVKELILFKNLDYLCHDGNYEFEVFSMSIVSDWERSPLFLQIELDDWVIDSAGQYIESIVSGQAAKARV